MKQNPHKGCFGNSKRYRATKAQVLARIEHVKQKQKRKPTLSNVVTKEHNSEFTACAKRILI